MVFPAQKTVPDLPDAPEGLPIFDTPSTEGTLANPEAVSSIGSTQSNDDTKQTQQTPPQDTADNASKLGKIVDKSINHKQKIRTLATPDPVTKKADEEENDFIPKVEEVHDAAHEQHR